MVSFSNTNILQSLKGESWNCVVCKKFKYWWQPFCCFQVDATRTGREDGLSSTTVVCTTSSSLQ